MHVDHFVDESLESLALALTAKQEKPQRKRNWPYQKTAQNTQNEQLNRLYELPVYITAVNSTARNSCDKLLSPDNRH